MKIPERVFPLHGTRPIRSLYRAAIAIAPSVTALALVALLGGASVARADADADAVAAILATLKAKIPELEASDIQPSAIDGIYVVTVGFEVHHIAADGRHLITGEIVDLESGERVNSGTLDAKRARMIDAINEVDMVRFPAPNEKTRITVFTDISCPYCRKLHEEVGALNARGVTVRYLAFPRAGVPSDAADSLASVWCAEDPAAAMTRAKRGETLPQRSCDNPVAEQYNLGSRMAIRGTPAIVLADGALVSGYLPAAALGKRALDAAR